MEIEASASSPAALKSALRKQSTETKSGFKSTLHNSTGDFGINTAPEHEQFVGFQLSKEEPEYVWDPEVTPVKTSLLGGSTVMQVHQYSRLLVKQAILSPDAKDGELNCVEVEGSFPRSLNKMPLAILFGGKDMQRYLDVYFPEPPLTFRLTHGTGPVFILAQSMIENSADDSDDEDTADDTADDTAADSMDEEAATEDEEEEAEPEEFLSRARNGRLPGKVEEETEDEEAEEEESEEEEPSPPKKKGKMVKSAKAKGKKKVEEEEESESEPESPKQKAGRTVIKPKAKAGKRK